LGRSAKANKLNLTPNAKDGIIESPTKQETIMPRYYAATNLYATEDSIGFYNTWCVLVFGNKKARDRFVESATDLATRPISRSSIGLYINSPKPFSGQAYVIHPISFVNPENKTPGLLGHVVVDDPEDWQRLN
jgi:hypothetical protein